jgi:hypothetical protein
MGSRNFDNHAVSDLSWNCSFSFSYTHNGVSFFHGIFAYWNL